MWIIKNLLSALLLVFMTSGHAETILKPINGQGIALSSLKGKWVLINYWAEWCHTCVQEIPELNQFFQNNKNKNVSLFAFNYDELPLKIQQKLIEKHHMLYPNLEKNPAQALALGDIPGVPVTFVFNPSGKLVKTLYGGQSASDLESAMSNH